MINKLINKYLEIEEEKSIPYKQLEDNLNVVFSEDFKSISKRCRFDYVQSWDWFSLEDSESTYGVVAQTLNLRRDLGLPKNMIYLSNDGTSCVLMSCCGDHEEVYWILSEDVYNLCENKPLEYNPKIFLTFPEFFEFLLNQREEEIRNEE